MLTVGFLFHEMFQCKFSNEIDMGRKQCLTIPIVATRVNRKLDYTFTTTTTSAIATTTTATTTTATTTTTAATTLNNNRMGDV